MVSAVLDIVCGRYRFEIGDGEYLIKLVKKSVVGILMWRTHTAGYGCEERHRYRTKLSQYDIRLVNQRNSRQKLSIIQQD